MTLITATVRVEMTGDILNYASLFLSAAVLALALATDVRTFHGRRKPSQYGEFPNLPAKDKKEAGPEG
jgi:hypothetical protein